MCLSACDAQVGTPRIGTSSTVRLPLTKTRVSNLRGSTPPNFILNSVHGLDLRSLALLERTIPSPWNGPAPMSNFRPILWTFYRRLIDLFGADQGLLYTIALQPSPSFSLPCRARHRQAMRRGFRSLGRRAFSLNTADVAHLRGPTVVRFVVDECGCRALLWR